MQFTREERHRLEEGLRGADLPACPACGGRLTKQEVPPPPGVSYVRHRVLILCLNCRRSAAVDAQR